MQKYLELKNKSEYNSVRMFDVGATAFIVDSSVTSSSSITALDLVQFDHLMFDSVNATTCTLSLQLQLHHSRKHLKLTQMSFGALWSIWDIRSKEGLGAWTQLNWTRKGEEGSHLEDQLDHLLDHPVEFLNSTGQASTRSS
ncbi:unnamed protein product [Microthlaspi erraticum]|uniref:Uncharacterized protein n=1 Tax=Microthlaspi erraticum TaxID=1685480 RepID=A0A6D2JEB5_9BRAS|nr:unnamed protein product [Microthlaspi erraticum]